MTNTTSRLLSSLTTAALMIFLAGCGDSGHSLGNSTGTGGAPGSGGTSGTSTGGAPGTGGAGTHASGGNTSVTGGTTTSTTAKGGAPGTGGSTTGKGGAPGTGGSAGGQGGTSTSSDAGSTGGDAGGTCGNVGDSCATRSCCGRLLCLNNTNPPSCYESILPPADSGADAPRSLDTSCPVCPAMKCTYGSPVDSNGCTLCQCNPPPDGGADTPTVCPLPEGCADAGADAGTPCPSTPPSDGGTCTGQTVCFYENCPGTGHTQASCSSGKWTVATGACGTVTCLGVGNGTTCVAGQVCLVRAGGALLVSCIDNPCAPGLVSADCSTVTAGCTPMFSTTSGLTYYCDTCASPICA